MLRPVRQALRRTLLEPVPGVFRYGLGAIGYGARKDPIWRELKFAAEVDTQRSVIGVAGLSGNGVNGLQGATQEIFRRLRGRASVMMANLAGHTGHYQDFRESGLRRWVREAWHRLGEHVPSVPRRQVVLIGHSTGVLVNILVFLLWRIFRYFGASRAQAIEIQGMIFWAPAFRLRSRSDRIQLAVALLFGRIVMPLGILVLLAATFQSQSYWAFAAVVLMALANFDMLHRIAISNSGPKISESKPAGYGDLLAAILYFVMSTLPWYVYGAIGLIQPFDSASAFVSLAGFTVACGWFVMRGVLAKQLPGNGAETLESRRYGWLPISVATDLVLLQALVSLVVCFVNCPILLLTSGNDELVDNRFASDLLEKRGVKFSSFELQNSWHYELTAEEQSQFAAAACFWIEHELGWTSTE